VERLTVVMSPLRYLARHDEALIKASSKLTAVQYLHLKDVVAQIELREESSADDLEKASTFAKVADDPEEDAEARTEAYQDFPSPGKHKGKLQATLSEVSMDSQGFPKMLQSPEDEKACKSKQAGEGASATRRRIEGGSSGSGDAWFSASTPALKTALGYRALLRSEKASAEAAASEEADTLDRVSTEGRACPKVKVSLKKGKAAAKGKAALTKAKASAKVFAKRPAAAAGALGKISQGSWIRLRTATAKTPPPRCYIVGTQDQLSTKCPLIVEVTQRWSSRYVDITHRILKSLQEDNISKEEALEMRRSLCERFP